MAEQEQTPQEKFEAALAVLKGNQRKFVLEYLVDLHGQNAAIRAGYSEATARSQASRMLTFVNIRAAIDAGMELYAMPVPELLYRLTREARGTMEDFLRVDEEEITLTWSLLSVPEKDGELDIGGTVMQLASQENVTPTDRILHTTTVKRSVARLDLLEAGKRGQLGLVKEYTLDEKGKVSIKLYDAQNAKQLLGRAKKLFVDRLEHSGKVDVSKLSDDELRALAES